MTSKKDLKKFEDNVKHYTEKEIKKYIKKELKLRGVKRVGKCLNCGKCCELGMIFLVKRKRNGEITSVKLKGNENTVCREYNKKTHKCKVYNKRQWICTLFPMLPEHLKYVKKTCGYKFVKIK